MRKNPQQQIDGCMDKSTAVLFNMQPSLDGLLQTGLPTDTAVSRERFDSESASPENSGTYRKIT